MKNLTIKTFITFMLMSVLIMGSIYLMLYIFTPYSGVKKYNRYIESESKELADKCMNISLSEAEAKINKFAMNSGANVKLIDSEDYNTDILSSDLPSPDLPEEASSKLSGDPDEVLTYPLHFSDRTEEYVLYIMTGHSRTETFRKSIILSLPFVLAAALILSFVGAKIFSYYMKKPIVRMSRIAQRMAEQDFDWYCPDERDDEIGVLAKSLNKLSDELSAALTKLNDKNLYLKNEISLEKERERRRMLFFSGVSHELKTPISVVIGQIEGMRSGIGVYKDRDKYLEKCSNTLNELVSFINEILLVSHIDMGDVDDQKTVRIDSILDEEIAFYDGLITEKNINLEYEVPDNVNFRGDENLLKKALGNVLGNAFKYTPVGGTVRVELIQKSKPNKPNNPNNPNHPTAVELRTTDTPEIFVNAESDNQVELRVINSPAHIDEQHLPHIFEAFYRADTSNKDGSGLGLYITGMVLEMFGAEYSVKNTNDGVEFKVVQKNSSKK